MPDIEDRGGSWEPCFEELVEAILEQGIADDEIVVWLADQDVTDNETIDEVFNTVKKQRHSHRE